MSRPDEVERTDELAADLDDLQRLADEIGEEPPAGADPETVKKLKDPCNVSVTSA